MQRRLRATRSGLVVLLIPTKETVFATASPDVARSEMLSALLSVESEMWSRTRSFLRGQSIEFIDATTALVSSFEAHGAQPYQISRDGHPSPSGHRAIAELVATGLRERQMLLPPAR